MARVRSNALASMAMLYAGKVSGVLVNLLFIPLYSHELGATQFGIIAVILSLQVLLVMLDLGLSTVVSREVAITAANTAAHLQLVRNAEAALAMFYILLFAGVGAAQGVGLMTQVDPVTAVSSVALFGLMVLQNLYYSTILARRAYSAASVVQLVGNLSRAGATAVVLTAYSATVLSFVVTQVVFALLHAGATRWYCWALLTRDADHQRSATSPGVQLRDALALIRQGKSLALFSVAGAAVMQLDKPIVLYFSSAASVAPYYLAMTICMVPISILAGPVAQYFQPQLLNAVAREEKRAALRIMKWFVLTIVAVTLLPSGMLWLLREMSIELWLGADESHADVAHYVAILLPGVALGALGFLPYSLLLSARDYKFQAYASSLMTAVTLSLAAIAAFFKSIEGVCVVYAAYHAVSTIVSWYRSVLLESTRTLATYGASLTLKIAIPCAGIFLVLRALY